MKTYVRRGQAFMALLLIFTLFIGLLPAPALAEAVREGDTFIVSGNDGPGLEYAVEELNKSGGGTIELRGDKFFVYKPLNITSPITITGSGTVSPGGTNWVHNGEVGENGPYGSLISVNGENVKLTINGNIIIDPKEACRAILVNNGASLHLSGCTIQKGKVTGTQGGAGVYVSGECTLIADGGTLGTVPLSHFSPGGVVSAGGLCYYGGSLVGYGVRICQEELDAAAKAGSIMLCSGGSTGQPSFTTMRITRRF